MMKRFLRGLSLSLALLLCLLPALAVAEDSMLTARMDRAYASGRQISAVFSAKLGDGVALFLPTETFDALQQLLQDTRITTHWAQDEGGQIAMDLSIGIGDTQVLDGTARMLEGSVAVETSLLPGKTVLIPIESLGDIASQQPLPVEISEETAALFAQAFETYFGIAMGWAQQSEGLLTQIEGPVPATAARSEAAGAIQLSVSAAQLRDLLVLLTAEFERDTQLQSALESLLAASGSTDASMPDVAKALSVGAAGLVPLDGDLKLDMYSDADGELVGLDLVMDPLFEGSEQTAFAQYDRLAGDGRLAYGFQGRIGFSDGGMAAAKLDFSADDAGIQVEGEAIAATQNLLLRGMMQPTAADPISQVTLTDYRQTELDGGQERLVDVIELSIESLTPDGAQAEGSMPLSGKISTLSITNEQANDDFDSSITVSLQALGMEFAALQLDLASGEYAPADTSGNAVVDLSTASPEEQEALAQELQNGLMMALMGAMQAVPPELLAMMQSE